MNDLKYDSLDPSDLRRISEAILGVPRVNGVENIENIFQTVNPRCIFFKNVCKGADLLDLGAGDGGLSVYKKWPAHERPDVKLHGLSLDVGVHHEQYSSWEIANFEEDNSLFGGRQFDAVVCAHFIEHMKSMEKTVEFLSTVLRTSGEVYLEWPHEISTKMPPREDLIKRGVAISTTNFYDDKTHVCPWDASYVLRLFEERGFGCRAAGRIYLPYIGEEMIGRGIASGNAALTTLGYWAYFGWSQYIVCYKK